MSFAGVIVFELGYDGETVRQHEFEGYTFDEVVAAPARITRLESELASARETARVWNAWAEDYKDQRDELLGQLEEYENPGLVDGSKIITGEAPADEQ